MLKHTKWKGKNPKKVIKTKEFQEWLIKMAQKSAKDLPDFFRIPK
jgi:hypothetical protein